MMELTPHTIRSLRAHVRMTQEQFAHALGITAGTANRWENGRVRPSKLAQATIYAFADRHAVVLDQPEDGPSDADASAHRDVTCLFALEPSELFT